MNRTSWRKICPALLLTGAVGLIAANPPDARISDRRVDGVIWVTSQNLFYDTIVVAELPPRGRFQLLEMGGPTGSFTEFGPGDPEYLGGRWWVDVNGNGIQDSDDDYFLCPLLPPGREEP